MILTEAKKRAQQEFDTVLAQTGRCLDELRDFEALHPQVRKITYTFDHHGVAGTAANYVRALARHM
jgi:hypothetical protein